MNVSNPATPIIVGRCSTHFGAGICVEDSLGYVAGGSLGFIIVNVANASSPFEIIRFPTRYSLFDVWISDTVAYLSSGGFLQIVNVKDPRNPYEIGYYGVVNYTRRLFYSGSNIFTANSEAGLMIFDHYATKIEEGNHKGFKYSNPNLYPNPTRGKTYFNQSFNNAVIKWRVFDVTGRELKVKRILNGDNLMKEVDLSDLKSGVFFLFVVGKRNTKVIKIIKI